MEFWPWFQTVSAVFVGNGLTLCVVFALAYLYRHESILKKSEREIPFWFYPLFLIPWLLMTYTIYTVAY